jgi:hypothetical protein
MKCLLRRVSHLADVTICHDAALYFFMNPEAERAALLRDLNRYESLRRSCGDAGTIKLLDEAIDEAKERLKALVADRQSSD